MFNMQNDTGNGKRVIWISVLLLSIITITAIYTNMWFLTAAPIGFLFGFFLQKGDLCGASAFSEVIMLKDWRKMWGLWVCIVVSMAGFALLDILGFITLNPKPFLWLNLLLGGVIFGIGMVLAGGCVSGCLFKAGTGNLNSMAALVGIPIGISAVEYGILNKFQIYIKSFVIKSQTGGPITLTSLTGIPFWILALGFGVLTIIISIRYKSKTSSIPEKDNQISPRKWLYTSWKPWQAGLAIGLLATLAYLSSAASGRNYPLGVTHGVLQAEQLITQNNFKHVNGIKLNAPLPTSKPVQPQKAPASIIPTPNKIVWWLVLLVISLVGGSFVSGKLSGQSRLLPKPPEQTIVAFFGGIIVGTGAAIGTGCVVGNIISGWALMSVGMFVFGITAILANWVTTYLYLMGGKLTK